MKPSNTPGNQNVVRMPPQPPMFPAAPMPGSPDRQAPQPFVRQYPSAPPPQPKPPLATPGQPVAPMPPPPIVARMPPKPPEIQQAPLARTQPASPVHQVAPMPPYQKAMPSPFVVPMPPKPPQFHQAPLARTQPGSPVQQVAPMPLQKALPPPIVVPMPPRPPQVQQLPLVQAQQQHKVVFPTPQMIQTEDPPIAPKVHNVPLPRNIAETPLVVQRKASSPQNELAPQAPPGALPVLKAPPAPRPGKDLGAAPNVPGIPKQSQIPIGMRLDCVRCGQTKCLRIRLRNCKHMVCVACLLEHLKYWIRNQAKARIKCPKGICPKRIHENDINAVLDEDEEGLNHFMPLDHRQWLQYYHNKDGIYYALGGAKYIKHCPLCKSLYTQKYGCNYVTCVNLRCRTKFCWQCGMAVKSMAHFAGAECKVSYDDIYRSVFVFRMAGDVSRCAVPFGIPIAFFLFVICLPFAVVFAFPSFLSLRTYRSTTEKTDFLTPAEKLLLAFKLLSIWIFTFPIGILLGLMSIVTGFSLFWLYILFMIIKFLPLGNTIFNKYDKFLPFAQKFGMGPYKQLLKDAKEERKLYKQIEKENKENESSERGEIVRRIKNKAELKPMEPDIETVGVSNETVSAEPVLTGASQGATGSADGPSAEGPSRETTNTNTVSKEKEAKSNEKNVSKETSKESGKPGKKQATKSTSKGSNEKKSAEKKGAPAAKKNVKKPTKSPKKKTAAPAKKKKK